MRNQPSPAPQSSQKVVGILSFEVASSMSKIINLHRSLTTSEISRLHDEVLKSHGVRTLISDDDSRLIEFVVAEKLDELDRAAAVVSRLGRRCRDPTLVGFEHVYADLLRGGAETSKLAFPLKDMEASIKKMERFVGSTANLYAELEALNELEQGAKKFLHLEGTRRAYEQKIQWQRHDVRHLRDVSLWNQTFDKVVDLMARSVCAVHQRMRVVFGETIVPQNTRAELSTRSVRFSSGRMSERRQISDIFAECLSLTTSASADLAEEPPHTSSRRSRMTSASGSFLYSRHRRRRTTPPKYRLAAYARPSTVGGSALALHYANTIVIIEKLLQYPHLVGEEARDDLYQMLPASLRSMLKKTLKSYVKDVAIYDAPLAHEWKERLGKVLAWLGPMAQSMIRWQTERNFEQQQIGPRGSVLLLQTIFFAEREKIEAAICELLVGLNYICRYEHQQSALLDCSGSLDFEDWKFQF